MMSLIILAAMAYCIGAIPFSLLVAKWKGVNLRQVGSGNLGATNVFRSIGWQWGVLVFILDAAKGYIPTFFALNYSTQPWIHVAIGALAIIGHSLTFFAGFKGGKGVATGLGFLLAISPEVALILFGLSVLGITLTRYVAPFSILGAILAPILLWRFNYPNAYIIFVSAISLFIVWRHRTNIKRLMLGQENKL